MISIITGGDGVERLKLEISGSYRGREGIFEYIREPNGTINHRLFVPKK
jgi:filamentous hemagglutinin